MKLFLSVFLPYFSIELIRRSQPEAEEKATLITERCLRRNKEIVLRSSNEARMFGASPGMNLASARACLEEVEVFEFNPEYEAKFLKSLAEWSSRFSPFVNTDIGSFLSKPDEKTLSKLLRDPRHSGLYLDVSGQTRVFGGYEELLKKLSSELARLGFSSRLAITPSYGASWALARYGKNRCYLLTEKLLLKEILGPLPVTALQTSRAIEDSLRQVNIKLIQDLYSIKPSELNKRFDKTLSERLALCLGEKSEAAKTLRLAKKTLEQIIFDSPLSVQESLIEAFRHCLLSLLKKLEDKEQKLSELLIEIKPVRLPCQKKLLVFSQPTSDAYHIEKISLPWLENINMGFGIEKITLLVEAKALVSKLQTDYLYKDDSSSRDLGELIDRLKHSAKTAHMHLHESYLPEKSFSFRNEAQTKDVPLLKANRPPLILEHPQPIKTMAMLPDHPPFQMTWKGQTYKLIEGSSSERINNEWWKLNEENSDKREYFRVKVEEGPWLWIYRQWQANYSDKISHQGLKETETNSKQTAQWFVHGIWT